MKVCIIGSCVSRDIFNLADEGEFEISLYVARNSIASMFSPPPFADNYSVKLKSAFQRKMVSWDIKKTLIAQLNAVEADFIMVDNIDDRFRLLVMPNGRRCTLSAELISVGAEKHPDSRSVGAGSPTFMKYWEHGWNCLVDLIQKKGLLDRLLVNKVYCQPVSTNGVEFNPIRVERINSVLAKIYEIQAKTLKPKQFIEYGELLKCPDDHRWGASPFHFCENSQRFALNQIRAQRMEMG